jgi:hypothetical protein
MRTIQTTVYKFDELSPKAQAQAIDYLYDINVSHRWWEFIYEDAKIIGLEITSFDLDRNRHAKGEFILSACEVAQNIFNKHGETTETYNTAKEFMEEWQPVFDEYMTEPDNSLELEERLIELENEFLKNLLDDYSIMLQNEYEYLTSEEAIIETIRINDYEFTEYGELI